MSRVVHFEIHADDPERAIQFYSKLFQWQFTKWEGPMDYWLIITGQEGSPGINGGLLRRMFPIEGQGILAYVCTIEVADVDRSLEGITSSGGSIALPKMPVPGVGWLAYAKDTEQNVFGIMHNDPSAK